MNQIVLQPEPKTFRCLELEPEPKTGVPAHSPAFTYQARNQRGHLRHLPPSEIFKTLHSDFDIYRNFQIIKMKFCVLMVFKKSYWNFSLSYW